MGWNWTVVHQDLYRLLRGELVAGVFRVTRLTKLLLLIAGTCFAFALFTGANAAAAEPTVTKVYRTYNSYRYTIAVDSAATVTGGPRANQDAPLASGGCKNVYRRMANGRNVYLHTTCPTPGTVRFTSPDFPACETPFTITVDGVTVYTDLLNAPCPPPPPPAGIITRTDTTLTFTNPADFTRDSTSHIGVDSATSTLTADGAFSYQVFTRFAGVGPNTYVYFEAVVTVTLSPGQTTTVTVIT